MKKYLSSFLLALLVLTTALNCNATDPEENEIKPGSRDYEWNIDTLFMPEGRTLPARIWATGPDNIWTVGPAYLNNYCIWHYDGTAWKNYNINAWIDPWGIYGFSKNDIWMGSSDGWFWHYDGVKWEKKQLLSLPGYKPFIVQEITGSSYNSIYAAGFADSLTGRSYKGVIFKYDGTNWKEISIPKMQLSFVQMQFLKKSGEYLLKSKNFDTGENKLFVLKGDSLKELVSQIQELSINNTSDETYIVTDRKIYKYQNEVLTLFKDFSNTRFLGALWGRNESDFFTINNDGMGHYNGVNIITIFPFWDFDLSSVSSIVFEKEVIFILIDSFRTYVIHGKLK